MAGSDQLDLERPPSTRPASQLDVNSAVKTILLHVQNDKSLDRRIQHALSLARSSAAHLSCLHVTPIEAYVAFDSFGGVFVMNDVITALDEQEARIRDRVEEELSNEDVSWDYAHVTGSIPGQIARYAALADLVVTSREPHHSGFAGPAIGLLGDLLLMSRTPLFIPSEEGPPCDPAGMALIAWNGSCEAANAVRSSVGMLKMASEIRILHVDERIDGAFPPTSLLEYLSRHGIHAEMRVETAPAGGPDPQFVAGSLIACALAAKAAYIVMGGYGHNRIGEFLLGGVTRTMLRSSPVPLFITH